MHGGVPSPLEARIDLLPSDSGLRVPMPSPTRSLLLLFTPGYREASTLIGVVVTALGAEALSPGNMGVVVRLEFWDPVDEHLTQLGDTFDLWYSGRIVGNGRILGPARDCHTSPV